MLKFEELDDRLPEQQCRFCMSMLNEHSFQKLGQRRGRRRCKNVRCARGFSACLINKSTQMMDKILRIITCMFPPCQAPQPLGGRLPIPCWISIGSTLLRCFWPCPEWLTNLKAANQSYTGLLLALRWFCTGLRNFTNVDMGRHRETQWVIVELHIQTKIGRTKQRRLSFAVKV